MPDHEESSGSLRADQPRNFALGAVHTSELVSELVHRLSASQERLVDKVASGDWLSRLSMLINHSVDVFDNRLSASNLRAHMRWILDHECWDPSLLDGKAFLELGCGGLNPFARVLAAFAAGAQPCVAVDLDPVHDPFVASNAAADVITWLITAPDSVLQGFDLAPNEVARRFADVDIARLRAGDPSALDAIPVRFENRRAEELALEDGEVGVSLSSAFLEHVPSLQDAITELARVTSPGAIGVHNVDASDHRAYWNEVDDPLEFLTVNTDEALVAGSNRVRMPDVARAFEEVGFRIAHSLPHTFADVTPELRARLAEPFASMDDETLGEIGTTFFVQLV